MIGVDASAMVDLLLQNDTGKKVAARILDPDETLHVPHLIEVEVTQVLRRFMLAGELTEGRGREALEAPLVTTDGKLSRAHGHEAQIELVEARG